MTDHYQAGGQEKTQPRRGWADCCLLARKAVNLCADFRASISESPGEGFWVPVEKSGYLLTSCDLVSLWSFLALHDVKFDIIAFLQALVPINLDGTVMDEYVGAVVASNKTVSLRVVEPLHLAFMLSHVPLTFLTAVCGWELPTCLYCRDAVGRALVFPEGQWIFLLEFTFRAFPLKVLPV
jgi:hypothetical protein